MAKKITIAVEKEITQRVLKHWHKAVPNDRLSHLVRDTSRGVVRSLQVWLQRKEVSPGHRSFLRVLWENDEITQRELSYEAGVMEPTTLIALRGMEKLGYIERRQAEGNRKNNYVFLTPFGRDLKHELMPLAEEVNRVVTRGMTAQETETLRRLLLKVIDSLVSDPVLSQKTANSPASS